jgi:hypothetical protein
MGKKSDTAKTVIPASPVSITKTPAPEPPPSPVAISKAASPAAINGDGAPAKTAVEKKPAKKAVKKPAAKKPVKFSTEDIALRAYFISEHRSQHGLHGDEHSDWVEAERQLKAEKKKAAAKPSRKRVGKV